LACATDHPQILEERFTEQRRRLAHGVRQIAQLARDQLANPEIGARLFRGPRMVEWHLRKVYGKLAIRSRYELADALARSDGIGVPV
jgi:DNA-binding CsgD family transcriptional regulator